MIHLLYSLNLFFAVTLQKLRCISTYQNKKKIKNVFFILVCSRFAVTLHLHKNRRKFMENSQAQTQRQEQQLRQIQTTTQQQVIVSQLMEMPLNKLLDEVNAELDDNPALEIDPTHEQSLQQEHDDNPHGDDNDSDDFEAQSEREERQSAFEEALENIGRDDDELPVYGSRGGGEQREEIVYGEEKSFYSLMMEQTGELSITDSERTIMEYLIGSLDDDGLLRKDLATISDELAIYHSTDISVEELRRLLALLQTFDPAGIGAQSLQECLLLQIRRRPDSPLKQLMGTVIEKHFDLFMKKDWRTIKDRMRLSDVQADYLNKELCKLNPKPGSTMGEVVGRSIEQITPDAIIDTNDDGTITFTLNNSNIPHLQVSSSFAETLERYKSQLASIDSEPKTRRRNSMRDGLLYTRQKVEQAQMFMYALNKRQETLTKVLKAIIHWQRDFFVDGDEASLHPMALKNISDITGISLSTVSRVCNSKYVQTRWGIFLLRHFFTASVRTENGNDVSQRHIKEVLQELVDNEDKSRPLGDEALMDALAEKGLRIARRTVAKYREQLGIPPARLRR